MAKNRPMGEDNVVDMIEKKLSKKKLKRSKSELQLLVLIEQEISSAAVQLVNKFPEEENVTIHADKILSEVMSPQSAVYLCSLGMYVCTDVLYKLYLCAVDILYRYALVLKDSRS